VIEFDDGSSRKLHLCTDHFSQIWSIGTYLAGQKKRKVVALHGDLLPKSKSARGSKS
jgi:hypothetical protein